MALKAVPDGMILETFTSLLGYCTLYLCAVLTIDMPKVDEWNTTHQRAMNEMENWGLSMGLPTVPKVSTDLLEKIIGNKRANRLQPREGGFFEPRQDFGTKERSYDGLRRRFTSGGRGRAISGADKSPWDRRGRRY